LNIGQFIGLHRNLIRPPKELDTPAAAAKRNMWHKIVHTDRYLGLILGLPCGTCEDHFEPDETFQNPEMDVGSILPRKLSLLTCRISERNRTGSTHTFAATQDIDERLDNLAKELPDSWWEVPHINGEARSGTAWRQIDHVLMQMWYFHLELFLHLPFMVRASRERRYEYSKFTCLKASRELIYRYLTLRRVNSAQLFSPVMDFMAFTATIMLVYDLLGSAKAAEAHGLEQQKVDDRALVEEVLTSMKKLASASNREVVAAQSVNCLTLLLTSADETGNRRNLRLTIPYLGTISIVSCPAPQRSLVQDIAADLTQQHPSILRHYMDSETTHSTRIDGLTTSEPFVSFTTSQLPTLGPELMVDDFDWSEADSVFFNSFLNTDIDGEWPS